MEKKIENLQQEIDNIEEFEGNFYIISHCLDKVLVGDKYTQYSKLLEEWELNNIIDLHIFNKDKAIFMQYTNDGIIKYESINNISQNNDKIERYYELDKTYESKNGSKYKKIKVIEYVAYDQESHMAYIKYSVPVELC